MDCHNCAYQKVRYRGKTPCNACIDATLNSGAFFPRWKSKWCMRLRVLGLVLMAIGLILIAVTVMFGGTARAAGPEDEHVQDMAIKSLPLDADDIDMLAKLVWSEARGVDSKMEKAAVIWCVLNRVDAGHRGTTIADVVTAPGQFAWDKHAPVKEDLRDLAQDVLIRWLREKQGMTDVGRVLPSEYLWFAGRNGHNWFRDRYRHNDGYWDWSLPNPYEEDSNE